MDKTTNGELIMCMGGGGSAKVEVPKPSPLPPPLPPPPAPKPPAPAPKPLQQPGAAPDIRIGAAKRQSSGRPRTPGKESLAIGSNQGLNI